MTIFELAPLFVAIGVAVSSGAILTKQFGISGIWLWIIALALGVASWMLYCFSLKKLGSWLELRKIGSAHCAQQATASEEPCGICPPYWL
jgi:hypothetical protein